VEAQQGWNVENWSVWPDLSTSLALRVQRMVAFAPDRDHHE
jgi:hypothetical protein